VLLLGDSFAEGAEVDEAETASAVLNRRLNDDGAATAVLNAGVRGWGTSQEYLYLAHQGLELRPDVVVLMFYVGNDLLDNSAELSRSAPDGVPSRPFYSLDTGRLDLTPVSLPSPSRAGMWLEMARERSALVNLIETGAIAKVEATGQAETLRKVARLTFADPQPPAFERAWAVTGALLVAMRDATQATGARFIVVVAPHKAQLDPDELGRLVRGGTPSELLSWNADLPNRRLAALASAHGIELLDLTPSFRADTGMAPLYFAENSHWTAAGHAVAAAAMVEALANARLRSESIR